MDNVVIGNLCQDPVLRQPQRGAQPLARFTLAVNRWRKVDGDYVQRAPVFHRVVCFGSLAENVSNSLRKGMEVMAVGEWVDDSYSDGQGQRRVHQAMEAKVVGPALRWATARVQKVDRRTDGDTTADPEPSRPRGTDALPVPIRAVPLPVSLHPAPPVPPPDVAAVTSQGEHESITSADGPAAPATIAPVAIAPVAIDPAATESAGRRRGGMHRRKQPEPDSAVARAG